MKRFLALSYILFLSSIVPAASADFSNHKHYCPVAEHSDLLDFNNDRLFTEVEDRYTESVDVANSDRWIYSKNPAFTWASETKVACGKAIGYLKSGHVNEENVIKCDCFHKRMRLFMSYAGSKS